jgi:hypothetical protein
VPSTLATLLGGLGLLLVGRSAYADVTEAIARDVHDFFGHALSAVALGVLFVVLLFSKTSNASSSPQQKTLGTQRTRQLAKAVACVAISGLTLSYSRTLGAIMISMLIGYVVIGWVPVAAPPPGKDTRSSLFFCVNA